MRGRKKRGGDNEGKKGGVSGEEKGGEEIKWIKRGDDKDGEDWGHSQPPFYGHKSSMRSGPWGAGLEKDHIFF